MEFHKYTISKKGWFRKSFEIQKDEKLVYSVTTKGFIAYTKLYFKDNEGKEVLVINRPLSFGAFKFIFLENGRAIGEMTKAILSKEYTLTSQYATYIANGNWKGNEYTIYLGDDDIAKISRKMMTNKNQYGVAIIEGNHDLYILAMVILIEVIRLIKRKRNS